MNGTLLSLTSATLKEMGSQFGHVIHTMLTSLTLTLTIKDYIQRGPSIPCHPWLMYIKSLPWLVLLPHGPVNTKSSLKYLIFDKYRPYFGWVNADTIKETFKHTTQLGASVTTFTMKRQLKPRNPALNVPRRHEAVATDTAYSDTPAVHSGVKMAQLFCWERIFGFRHLPHEVW